MSGFRPALLALSCSTFLALPVAGLAAGGQFELSVYSPISINEVTRQEDCTEVVAAGNRINATCADKGSFAVSVIVRQIEAENVNCVISLKPGDRGPQVGHDADDYDSEQAFEDCKQLVDVAPGGEMLGQLTFHITRSAW